MVSVFWFTNSALNTRSSVLVWVMVSTLWFANSALTTVVTLSISWLCYNACDCLMKKYKKYISLHHMRKKLLQSIYVKPNLSSVRIVSISIGSFSVSCCKREKWCLSIIVCWDRVKILDMELLLFCNLFNSSFSNWKQSTLMCGPLFLIGGSWLHELWRTTSALLYKICVTYHQKPESLLQKETKFEQHQHN